MNDESTIADTIPDPTKIRARLSTVTREAALLRSLLRVAEQNRKRHELDEQVKTTGDTDDRK